MKRSSGRDTPSSKRSRYEEKIALDRIRRRPSRGRSPSPRARYRSPHREERYPYKVLCVSALHPKANDEVIKDTLYQEYKKYGDLSIKLSRDLDEKRAYVCFRSSEDARDANHCKPRIIINGKVAIVEPVYEESGSADLSYRPRSITPEYDRGYYARSPDLLRAIDRYDHRIKESLEAPPPVASSSAQPFPDILLPVFSGEHSSWPAFKELFESLVIRNSSISDVERLHYLNSSLQSTPLKIISGLLTGASFPVAWNNLSSQYENKRLLLEAQCDKIFSTPPYSPEKNPLLYYKTLLANINDALLSLNALGQPVHHWDVLLVYIISRKLDGSTRERWESLVRSSTDAPPLSRLMEFLQSLTNSLEILDLPENSTKMPNSRSKITNRKASSKLPTEPASKLTQKRIKSKKKPTYNCDDCQEDHFIAECPRFPDRSPSERFELVTRKQLCFNCLGRHNISSCRNSHICRLCSKRHHTTLHDQFSKAESKSGASKKA